MLDLIKRGGKAAAKELEEKAFNLCSKYLGAPWQKIEKFQFNELNGGLTNKMFICSTTGANNEELKVILRVYGLIMQDVDAQITESVVFGLLGNQGIGPKLYGAFPEGRLEEYIPGRNLANHEPSIPIFSRGIASRMADFHQLDMPMQKDPRLLEQIIGYYKKAESLGVDLTKYIKEFDHACNLIKHSTSSILFCHNDVHEGNILISAALMAEGKSEVESMKLIDFEYSGYGHRGQDFANHFNEWMFDYDCQSPPFFKYNPNNYPTDEQQRIFFSAYMEQNPRLEKHEENMLRLQAELVEFTMITAVYWALWSEIQAKVSSIQFNYVLYAESRMDYYYKTLNQQEIPQDATLNLLNDITKNMRAEIAIN